jgi:hypothetical protein
MRMSRRSRRIELLNLGLANRFELALDPGLLFLGRQHFLNADLVDEMFTSQINQVRTLLIVRQIRANALGHYHHKRSVIHVEPIGAADKPIFSISHEWTVRVCR